jgi:dihydrofolate reductase
MVISLIAAMSSNRIIGHNNRLPWQLPADLEHFKDLTRHKPFIMGRRSYESPDRLLSDSRNIILSKQSSLSLCDQCELAGNLDDALGRVRESSEVFVLGGESVFRQVLPMATKIYLTEVEAILEGDAIFPEIDPSLWKLTREEFREWDRYNRFNLYFREYTRVAPVANDRYA